MPGKPPARTTFVMTHADTVSPRPPQVPGYDFLRRIGGGAYGEVWLAENEVVRRGLPELVTRSNGISDFARMTRRKM